MREPMRCPPGKTPNGHDWLGRPTPHYTEAGYLERERKQHPDLWIEAGPYPWWTRALVAPAYLLEWFGMAKGSAIIAALFCGSLIGFGFVLGRIVP